MVPLANNRKDDVIDILTKVTVGWITPPVEPHLAVETAENPLSAYLVNETRAIIIKKDYEHQPLRIGPTVENSVYVFNCVIIDITEDGLQLTYDQMVEVFNRYTASPHSTNVLGTSTTYTQAWVTKGKQDIRLAKFVMDVTVTLAEQFKDIVIA